MNIILFGPPGIGKSTIIGTLKTLGQRAIDLEDLYPNKIRFSIPNFTDGTFLGGADLNPKRKYNNALKVLLVMDQKAYETRRKLRDQAIPGKAAQSEHRISDWKTSTANQDFDLILDVSPAPIEVAKTLISFKERRLHHGNK